MAAKVLLNGENLIVIEVDDVAGNIGTIILYEEAPRRIKAA